MRKDLFSYQNYRHFMRDFLQLQGLTYREFVDKYSKKNVRLTPMTISKILSKNPKGEYTYTIKDCIWTELLKVFKLKKAEVEFMTILKIFNDYQTRYPPAHPLLRAVKGSLNKLKTVDRNLSKFSANSLLVAEAYDSLPEVFSRRITDEAYKQVEYCMQGMRDYSMEHGLHKVRTKIGKII